MTTGTLLAILLFLFIAAFYIGLPDLRHCLLPDSVRRENFRSGWPIHVLLCGAITLVYAIVAFYQLGNTEAPSTFVEFTPGTSATIELAEPAEIESLFVYTGANTGSYDIIFSADGETWWSYRSWTQDYASLFKWNTLPPATVEAAVKYIRITGTSGNPRIGEVAIISDGTYLQGLSCSCPGLVDEQELVPAESTYLNSTYFDEIYHARTAYEFLEELPVYETSHPPLGKSIISIGISLFGMTPFGWRFMGTFFGVLMLPMLYAFVWLMFKRKSVAAAATTVFAFDFMHFTQTRLATVDTYGVFFIIAMYLFFWLYMQEPIGRHSGRGSLWLFLSGIMFGLGAASKWICIYAGAGLAVLWLVHHLYHRKEETIGSFFCNVLLSTVFFVVIPALIYYVSYLPFAAPQGLHGISALFSKEYLQVVLENQSFMFRYHSALVATHPYSSVWYQWIFDIRPILYYLQYYSAGMRSSFGAFVSPLLCWGGILAMVLLLYPAIFRKDRTALFILIGYLAQLLPWVFITRLTFEYHYFPSTVFLTLAIAYSCSLMRENRTRRIWMLQMGALTAVSFALFILFYPVLSGKMVHGVTTSHLLQWLPTWPF